MQFAFVGERIGSSPDFHLRQVPERMTVRHAWARQFELGSRADDHDSCPAPYTNWGFSNRLDFVLAQLREARVAS